MRRTDYAWLASGEVMGQFHKPTATDLRVLIKVAFTSKVSLDTYLLSSTIAKGLLGSTVAVKRQRTVPQWDTVPH
jgi:hypothetical protein